MKRIRQYNGIKPLIPEIAAAIVFGIIFVLHLVVLWKVLLPRYQRAFSTASINSSPRK